MMDRLQRMRRMHLSRFEDEHAIALPPHLTESRNALFERPETTNQPLTFKAFFTKAEASREKQSKSYSHRLKKLNAFGLHEVTDRDAMALLACMGYHTGKDGVSKERRRRILDRIYFNNLRKDCKEELVYSWGRRSPEERLRLLAETLAYVCLSRENEIDPDALIAVRELKEDLDYLRRMYYYPTFNYAWPAIASGADRIISRTIMVKSEEEVRVNNLFLAVYTLTRKLLSFS
ncbi:hypothetical protein [Robertkochia sediminum]|uniref:hypothetical protein n=1 Tax=Robertkochia sediminum TaxID=2785326 RepID=UPI0019324B47|nr:hypothetical protein [Robertkochia sediminum]MBL7471546.1 hypothetical protein [Robertkochia sediminum]